MIIQQPGQRIFTIPGPEFGVELRVPSGGLLPPQTNLIEWLEASEIVGLSDGDPISTWTAHTGTNATATLTARPLYKANIQNGQPVVRADGSNDYMLLTGLTASSGSFTFVWALNPALVSSGSKYFLDSSAGRLILGHSTSFPGKLGWYELSWKTPGNSVANWQILTWVLTSGGNGEVFRNGISLGTGNYVTRGLGGDIALFSQNNGATSFIGCDVYGMLIYTSALDAATRAQAEQYFNAKLAIY